MKVLTGKETITLARQLAETFHDNYCLYLQDKEWCVLEFSNPEAGNDFESYEVYRSVLYTDLYLYSRLSLRTLQAMQTLVQEKGLTKEKLYQFYQMAPKGGAIDYYGGFLSEMFLEEDGQLYSKELCQIMMSVLSQYEGLHPLDSDEQWYQAERTLCRELFWVLLCTLGECPTEDYRKQTVLYLMKLYINVVGKDVEEEEDKVDSCWKAE